jgi:hypothetical protein
VGRTTSRYCTLAGLGISVVSVCCSDNHSDRAVEGVGLVRLDTGVDGSYPRQGMVVCPRLLVLCSTVYVEALCPACPLFRESYQRSK